MVNQLLMTLLLVLLLLLLLHLICRRRTEYVRHVMKRNEKERTQKEHFEVPYRDFLQAPLQPLQDNLESQVQQKPNLRARVVKKSVCFRLMKRLNATQSSMINIKKLCDKRCWLDLII